jgi:uncharacterized membrane protein YgcG
LFEKFKSHKSSNFNFKLIKPFAMKLSIPLLAVTAVVFSSCVSAYKTGQTPDDVYFSPAREEKAQAYVQLQERDDRYYRGSDYYEDRFLRMRMTNRYRWSALDDYYFYNTYAYSPYGFYNNNWYSPWNSYYAWNNYYNPYYGGIHCYPGTVIIKYPQRYTPPSRAIAFNPNSYTPNSGSRTTGARSVSNGYNSTNGARYNNSNSNRSSFGESVRKVFSNSNSNGNNYNSNSNNSNNSTPTRSYTPSSSSSSSSSSSGGSSGGGGVSRPPR